jgi:hypothetical protein
MLDMLETMYAQVTVLLCSLNLTVQLVLQPYYDERQSHYLSQS